MGFISTLFIAAFLLDSAFALKVRLTFSALIFKRKTNPQNPFRIQVRKKRKFEILCFFALSPAHFPGNQTECHLPFFSWDRHACRMETATQVCTAKRASRTETFGPDARVQGL